MILQKAATELNPSEITLLRYFVTAAWRKGEQHPVKRTLSAMANHLGIKSHECVKKSLNTLLEKKLLMPTGNEDEYNVDCTPMNAKEWISVKQLKWKTERKRKEQATQRQRGHRDRLKERFHMKNLALWLATRASDEISSKAGFNMSSEASVASNTDPMCGAVVLQP